MDPVFLIWHTLYICILYQSTNVTSSVQLLLGGVEMVHQGEYQIFLLPTRIVWAPTILKVFGQSTRI